MGVEGEILSGPPRGPLSAALRSVDAKALTSEIANLCDDAETSAIAP